MGALYVAVRSVVGSTDVWVLGVGQDRAALRRARAADADYASWYVLEVYCGAESVTPRVGDRLSTWVDGITTYAIALTRRDGCLSCLSSSRRESRRCAP